MAQQRLSGNRVGRFFASLTDRVYRAVANGPVGRFFSAYSVSERIFRHTGVSRLARFGKRKRKGNALRRGVAEAMDRSFLRRACYAVIDALCRCSMRTVGLFFLTMGAYAAIVDWLIASVWQGGVPDALGLFFGLSFVIVGVLLLFSDMSVGYAIAKSTLPGWLMRDLLGISEDALSDMPRTGKQGYALAVPIGMLVGAVSALTGPVVLLLAALLALLALTVFTTPEAGVVLLIMYAPFIGFVPYGELWLALGVCLALAGYICKLLRGTRAFHMEVQDFTVLLLLVFTLLSGVSAGEGALARVMMAALMIAAYFPAVNTLATPQWLVRCRWALLGSATVASMLGILQFIIAAVVAAEGTGKVTTPMLSASVRAGFADHTTFAYFLVLVFPFALYAFLHARPRHRIPAGLACVSIVVAAALSFVQSAWIALAVELLVMCLLCAKYFAPYLAMILAVLPGAVALLPASWRANLSYVMIETADISSARMRGPHALISRIFFENGEGFFGRGEGVLRLLFGLGNGGLEAVCVLYAEISPATLATDCNFWMYRLAESGIAGVLLPAVLFFLLLQNCFSLLYRARESRGYILPVFGVAMVFGLLVFSAFRYSWYDSAALFLFFAMIAVISADARHQRSQENKQESAGNSKYFAEVEYQIKETKSHGSLVKEDVNEL